MNGLDDITIDDFSSMENVVVSIATYGEGEMPDNAQLFWEALSSDEMNKLPGMKFAVLALGDTGYDEFCQAGKLLDRRLEELEQLVLLIELIVTLIMKTLQKIG